MRRKIAVILGADVAGYSRLIAEDEEETLRRLSVYRGVLEDFVSRSGGRIFSTAGDGFMAEFPSAVDAVRCAIDTQESLRTRNLAYPASRQMAFRMGLTIGDVVDRDGDLLGDGVNIAARLQTLAEPGRICISKSVYDAVANKISVHFTDLGPQQVKNIPNPVHVFGIVLGSQGGADVKPAAKPVVKRPNVSFNPMVVAIAAAAVIGSGGALYLAGVLWPPKKPAIETPKTDETAKANDAGSTKTTDVPPVTETTKPDETKPAKKADAPATDANTKSSRSEDVAAAGRLRATRWNDCKGIDADAAMAACSKLVDDSGVTGVDLALAHQKLAMAERQSGKVDAAIASFTKSIGVAESTEAYNERGTAYFLKGQIDDAIADYDRAIALDGDNGDALNNRAWAYYKQGKLQQAKSDVEKAKTLIENKADVWDTRGYILEALGDRQEAIKSFQKALSINPSLETSSASLKRLGAK